MSRHLNQLDREDHQLIGGLGAGRLRLCRAQTRPPYSDMRLRLGRRDTVTAAPIPAALPLFAGGLGLLGYLSPRRKQAALRYAQIS